MKYLLALALFTVNSQSLIHPTEAWIPVSTGGGKHDIRQPPPPRRTGISSSTTGLIRTLQRMSPSAGDNGDDSLNQQQTDAQQQQRLILEELSLKGAAKIAKMGIPERAKRAMLAEAVEDRIFELTEVMEALIQEDGTVPEGNRKKAVDLAKQTKKLQEEYKDLVNGSPSSVLIALDSIANGKNDEP